VSYEATITCQFCGWDTAVEAPTPESLRDEIDSIGCWHTCCKVCKQAIVWYEDGWWHLASPTSTAPKDIDPRGVDLDADHQAVPAQSDGDVSG
jgi:hypothetical protein